MAARKKKSRTRLTHLEVRRGRALRLRLAIADDALAEAGDELGMLVMKLAPSAVSTCAIPPEEVSTQAEFVISPGHPHDDVSYHAGLRERLAELFGSLCDTSLADALEIAREERARRAEGGN